MGSWGSFSEKEKVAVEYKSRQVVVLAVRSEVKSTLLRTWRTEWK